MLVPVFSSRPVVAFLTVANTLTKYQLGNLSKHKIESNIIRKHRFVSLGKGIPLVKAKTG